MATNTKQDRAFRFGAKKLDTGTYTVTNTTKRKVVRAGVAFPGITDGEPVPVEVEIKTPNVHYQLRTCKALELKKGKAPAKGRSDSSDDASGDGDS